MKVFAFLFAFLWISTGLAVHVWTIVIAWKAFDNFWASLLSAFFTFDFPVLSWLIWIVWSFATWGANAYGIVSIGLIAFGTTMYALSRRR